MEFNDNNTPLVSVVMAVYNGDTYLCEAIESILRQTYQNFEFIIIDDGSTDESLRLLREFARLDPRVCIVTQENAGLAVSLNRGIQKARGKYIARMDADDISLPERFKLQVAKLEEYPELAVVGGQVRFFGGDDTKLLQSNLPLNPQEISRSLKEFCVLVHPAVMFRKDIIVSLGGYRPCFNTAQDYDLWLRVDECAKLANLPDVVLDYRTHNDQLSVNKLSKQALCWLAASESARHRKVYHKDTLTGKKVIDLQTMKLLGLDSKEVFKNVLRFAVRSALNAAARGGKDQAIHIMKEMSHHDATRTFPRLARAHQAWVKGYLCRFEGKSLDAMGYIVLAILLEPSYFVWFVRTVCNKIR